MSLNAGDTLPADTPAGNVPAPVGPAWLHVAVAWSVAVIGLVAIVVLAILHDPIPAAVTIITSVAGGGALGLTQPLNLAP